MAIGTYRVLKRKGRVSLVETANPAMGVAYSIREGTLGIWSGDNRLEAERQFEQSAN